MGLLQRLPRSSAEAQGVLTSGIMAFLDGAQEHLRDLHSFMLVRHGQVVAEGWWSPYAPTEPHLLYSLSKSFTSTAIGFAVAEGRLSVDDFVVSFFPDQIPTEPSANLRAMRVRHLLTMSTGHEVEPVGVAVPKPDSNWIRDFLQAPVPREPGSLFVYNSGATYMLAAILAKLTGLSLLDYLKPRVLEPLGIEGATWELGAQGICAGGWGLSLKTEDIACFGQMYLQQGMWQGHQVVPAAWVKEATRMHIMQGPGAIDWMQGYGYQFWRCQHGAYRGDGAFGQYIIIMPEQDAVLVMTSGLGDMQKPLDLVWEHLLPAFQPQPLPADPAGQRALTERTAGLSLPTVKGTPTNATSQLVNGKTYRLTTEEGKVTEAQLNFEKSGATLTLQDEQGTHTITCGHGTWQKGQTTLRTASPEMVAASSAWEDAQTWVAKLYFYRTPFSLTLTAHFAGNQLRLERQYHVNFGPLEMPPLTGQMA